MQGHRRRKGWTSTKSTGQEPSFSEDCIFCKIVAGEAEATIVYEDPETLSFLDVHPLNPGHIEAGRVFATVAKVMKSVRKVSSADGISIGQSNGKAASQEVFHMHVHIIPRFNHEMMTGFPNRKQTRRTELDDIGKRIRKAI